MNIIERVSTAWGWTGIEPTRLVDTNQFGNLILEDADGRFWRICPEELSCSVVAEDASEYAALIESSEFKTDWEMGPLVALAHERVGRLSPHQCYCLKVPAVLGGQYDADNLGSISLEELVATSANLACQIKDLPDGTKVELVVKRSD